MRIGRGVDNELQIDNLALSRYHASVECVDGLYVLKDFGSQNGTFVNGEKVVGRRALNDGDRIGLGKFIVVFRHDGTETAGKKVTKIDDEAAFAVAGETLVAKNVQDTRERTCPHVGYLTPAQPPPSGKPQIHSIARDVFVIGSQAGCDVAVDGGPGRAAAIVRGWRGFSLIPLGGTTRRNADVVELRADLADGDQLDFAGHKYVFHMGTPEAGP